MLEQVSKFIVKSGLRKMSSGLYMFSVAAYLCKLKVLSGELFIQFAVVVALALLACNVLEHLVKAVYPLEKK